MSAFEARSRRMLFLVSPSTTPCGVEMFARGLSAATAALGETSESLAVDGGWRDIRRLWSAPRGANALVISFPVVAWKRALLMPLLALAFARSRGASTVVILHEWADLNPLRRLFVSLYLLAAETVLFSSPTVQREFEAGPMRWLRVATGLTPIPPNIAPPPERLASPALERIQAERAKGSLILGHFGSIYPKKQSAAVLDIAAALRAKGKEVFVVFIGGFIRGQDDVEGQFWARAKRLGVDDLVLVTGYMRFDTEIFALFDEVDVFAYAFTEGLTSRRGSVLACLESGRPVVVNAPALANEFDHHQTYKRLIADGLLRFVSRDAEASEFANAILAIEPGEGRTPKPFFASAWRDAAEAVHEASLRDRGRLAGAPASVV